MISRFFARRRNRSLLLVGLFLVLAVIALSVFSRQATETFAKYSNQASCHTKLTLTVPSRNLIMTPEGCKDFRIRVVAQPYPTQFKVCPQMTTAGPVFLRLLGDQYQERDCFFWTARTGEWHSFYTWTNIADTVYNSFLVILKGPEDHDGEYKITVELQQ